MGDHYSQYVTVDFHEYIARKRQDRVFGDSLELQAISEMFSRPVEVYSGGEEPLNTFHVEFHANAPLRVSYHNRNHYNAVIDPRDPNCGVGLGLPGMDPQIEQHRDMEEAVNASEQQMLEETRQASEREQIEQALINSLQTDNPSPNPPENDLQATESQLE